MAIISNDEINNIRTNANIVDIVNSYIPLTQRGKNFIGVCPFHDDHSPSMSVSSEKQIYKCFACGATGNVFTFVSEYENVPFYEAVNIVANKIGMKLSQDVTKVNKTSYHKEDYEIMELAEKFFQNNLKTTSGKIALKYLHERGISDDIIKDFGIGLSLDDNKSLINLLTKKNYDISKLVNLGLANDIDHDTFTRRITFPLWDKDGHIVGFSARIYRNEKDISKYMNSKETSIFKKGETLYNYHNAKDIVKREKKIIVVEGFMDAIRISENGIKNVVALQGTAMTIEQITLLKKLRVPVILCLDNDNAGLLATINNGEELVKNNVEVNVIRLSGSKDPDEYILANGIEAFVKNVNEPLSFFDFKMSYLKQGKNLTKAEDLSEYINAIIKDLAKSNDIILKEVTLKKLSETYNISLDTLKTKLEELTPNNIEIKEVKPIKEEIKRNAYNISAEKILYFMMNGGIFISEYQEKLGYFDDEKYRNIANEILYYYDKYQSINIADFLTYVVDKEEIKQDVERIVNEDINDEITVDVMDDYIDSLLKINTKNEIKKLKDAMKKELDVDKKMKIAMQIAELKKGSV